MAYAPNTIQAAEFLARALPWPQEGGPPFYVNIHFGMPAHNPKPGHTVVFPGRACTNVREAASVVEWANTLNDGKGTDIYVCMSAQSDAIEKSGKGGRLYYSAIRRGENAVALKSFFVDVDVKAGAYPDMATAAAEFGRIRKSLGLPAPSYSVSSGSGGFHIHWILVDPIALNVWQPLAHALVAGLKAHGFVGDTGCTIDAARLLRVPNTWNHKQGLRRPVEVFTNSGLDYNLEAIAGPLAPYIGTAPVPVSRAQVSILGLPSPLLKQSKLVGASLSEGVQTPDPISIMEAAKVCPWIHGTLSTNGAKNDNPLWLASTNLSLFTSEGRDAAHWMASGHPGYSVASTDELYQRQLQTKFQHNLGWPQCRSIHSNGAPQCASCPHLVVGKSPLNFVQRAPTLQIAAAAFVAPIVVHTQAKLPQHYCYDAKGIVSKVLTDDVGVITTVPLTSTYPMDKPWMQLEPPTLNFTTFTHDGHERQIRVPYEVIAEHQTLMKHISRQGMLPHKYQMPELSNFMVSWIETLAQDRANVIQNAPFGWALREGKVEGFVYAGHVWSSGQPRPASNPDPVLAAQYSPQGTLEAWLAGSKMITDQERPALNAMLAASFGAPLVRFTGQTGLLMSTYSQESGIGKTTVLKVAQAAWAKPSKSTQSLNDTQNSVIKKIGDIKNLPMFWDELKTDEDTRRFVGLAFQLAAGKEKSRLSSDTSYRDPGTWQTLLVATSNDSIMQYVTAGTKTTAAGMYRVFEFVVPPGVKGQISPATAQQITAALEDNYGEAGLKYAQFLGAHHERVAKEVDEQMHALEKLHAVRADERFWLAMLTVVSMGARYSNQLGLTSINETHLMDFLVQTFTDLRRIRTHAPVDITNAVNVLSLLARYLNEKKRKYSLTTSHIHVTAGRPPAAGAHNAVKIVGLADRLDELQVQYGEADKILRMRVAPFDEWLTENGLSRAIVMKQLVTEFKVLEMRGRLGAGTIFSTAIEPIMEFNFTDPQFQGFIEV